MELNLQEYLKNKEKSESLIKTIFILCVIVFLVALGFYIAENKTVASNLIILSVLILFTDAILIMISGINYLNEELRKNPLADE